MMQSPTNKYLESSIQLATPAQLLIMLCDGGIRFCRLGIEAIKQSKLQEANHNLCRVQDIIREFQLTLDKSSPLAQNLNDLYDYFLVRLIEANTKKDIEPAQEVLGYLLELKQTWVEAAKMVTTAKPVGVRHG